MAFQSITAVDDITQGVCDVGLPCCPHGRSGTNATHSRDVTVNSRFVHRKGDTGPCNCPHGGTFSSIGGSSTVFVNSLPVTRIDDLTQCLVCGMPGNHASGSPDVLAGD